MSGYNLKLTDREADIIYSSLMRYKVDTVKKNQEVHELLCRVERLQLAPEPTRVFGTFDLVLRDDPTYITGDAIKDAPTGLYKVHWGNSNTPTLCAVVAGDGDCNYKKVYETSTASWWPLVSNIDKLEPILLDEPIKQEPVPEVGRWYFVKANEASPKYVPMECILHDSRLMFTNMLTKAPIDDWYAWDTTPIERAE